MARHDQDPPEEENSKGEDTPEEDPEDNPEEDPIDEMNSEKI